VAHTLVSPVALIGLSLVYFDQRVRHEGLDLLMLLGPEVAPGAVTMASSEVVAVPVVVAPVEVVSEDVGRVDDEPLV
jgi:hypothetical protein